MTQSLPIIYGWLVGSAGGGIFQTIAFWIDDTIAREHSTFSLAEVFFQASWMSIATGVLMSPGVIVAAAIYFLCPTFRGPRSYLVACGAAVVTVWVTVLVSELFRDLDLWVKGGVTAGAIFSAMIFWWITTSPNSLDARRRAENTRSTIKL